MIIRKFQKFYLFIVLYLFLTPSILAQNNSESVDYYKDKLQSANTISLDSALYFYDKLIDKVSLKQKANLLRKKGLFLIDKNLNKAAERELLKAKEIVENHDFIDVKSKVYHDLGYHYYILNNSVLAYKYFLLSRDLYEKLNDVKNLSIVNTNIGSFLSEEGKFEEAEKLYYKSLLFYNKTKDTIGIIYSKINLASLMRDAKDYQRSIDILSTLGDYTKYNPRDRSLVLYNFALTTEEMNELVKANEYIDEAIELSTKIDDSIQLIDLYYLKAEIEQQLGNYSSALSFFRKSLKETIAIEDLSFEEEILKRIMEVKIKSKRFDEVDTLFSRIMVVHDSLSKLEQNTTYNEIYLENRIDKNEKIIFNQQTDLEKEKKLKILYLAISLISVLALLSLGFLFYFFRKNSRKSIYLMEQKARIKEIEIENKRKIEEYEKKSIQDELKAKNKELLLSVYFTKKRNKNLKLINSRIDKISNNSVITKDNLLNLKDFIKEKTYELDNEENIQQKVVETHKVFFNKMLSDFPELTQTELKVLAYIRINLNTKEIANIQNVSIDAIRKTRYRIRKKLQMQPDQSLEKFILQYY